MLRFVAFDFAEDRLNPLLYYSRLCSTTSFCAMPKLSSNWREGGQFWCGFVLVQKKASSKIYSRWFIIRLLISKLISGILRKRFSKTEVLSDFYNFLKGDGDLSWNTTSFLSFYDCSRSMLFGLGLSYGSLLIFWSKCSRSCVLWYDPCLLHTPPCLAWFVYPSLLLHSFFFAPCLIHTPPFLARFVHPLHCIVSFLPHA